MLRQPKGEGHQGRQAWPCSRFAVPSFPPVVLRGPRTTTCFLPPSPPPPQPWGQLPATTHEVRLRASTRSGKENCRRRDLWPEGMEEGRERRGPRPPLGRGPVVLCTHIHRPRPRGGRGSPPPTDRPGGVPRGVYLRGG